MKIVVALITFASIGAQANNWFVVDKAPEGKVPFYLQPNENSEQVANTTVVEQAEAVLKTAEATKATDSIPGLTAVPKKPQSMLVIKSDKEFRTEVATKERISSLPSYEKKDQVKQQNQSISNFVKNLGTAAPLSVSSEAVPADPSLKNNRYGVPRARISFAMTKDSSTKAVKVPQVEAIPDLNIGRPEVLSASEFAVPGLEEFKDDYGKLSKLKSPKTINNAEMARLKKIKISKVKDNREFDLKELVKADELVAAMEKTGYVITQNTEIHKVDLHKIGNEEMLFMQAEILYSKGDQCHAAAGLYYGLLKAKNADYRTQAKLKLGICSHKMGLFTDSIKRLISVLDDKVEAPKKDALKALLSDLPIEYQLEIGEYLYSFRDYHLLQEADKPAFNYVVAKYLADIDRFSEASLYAEKVSKESPYYARAQYIASVSEYLLGKKEVAFQRQNQIEKHLKDTKSKEDVSSLVAISKARMNFQRRKYKESIEEFLKIDRNHPMWIEGLQQQAWAQLMVKDEPGAIGNMHSIHTPFFRQVYKPESYVIRGLGYINLCQYADAYKSVKNLEYKYKKDLAALKSINKKNSKKLFNYYKLAANYLAKPKAKHNLSDKLIREAVRQRKFLNQQDAINKTYDETEQYNFLVSILDGDIREFRKLRRNAKKRKQEAQAKLASIKKDKKLLKHKLIWTQQRDVEDFLVRYYGFRINNYKFAKKGMQRFSKASLAKLRDRRNHIKMEAAAQLKKSFHKMEKNVAKMLQNNELLKYEIFSGAGENLRYRISGGKTVGKGKAVTSDLKKEGFNWEFDGEFWEDEVGHYRSSLKNACPKNTASR